VVLIAVLQRAIGFGITFGLGMLFSFLVSKRRLQHCWLQQADAAAAAAVAAAAAATAALAKDGRGKP
jgi:hypothetical protein